MTGSDVPPQRRLDLLALGRRLATGATAAAALAFVALFLAVALMRIGYPYELEWMEGGTLDHVRRVLAGQPLYVAPTVDFVPFIYPPAFYWASALVAGLAGPGFLAPRLVSLASAVGLLGLLFAWARRETGRIEAGLLAAGLFAATYRIGGAWLDLARVDALFLLCPFGGLYLFRFHLSARGWLAGAACLALGFLVKQTALAIAAPVLVWALVTAPRRGLAAVATLGGLVAGAVLLLDARSGGWFRFYVLDLPQTHDLQQEAIRGFWATDLLATVGLAVAAAVLLVVRRGAAPRAFYAALLVGGIGAAWSSRLHSGGWNNVLLPAYAAVALAAAIAFGTLAATEKLRLVGTAAVLAQLGWLAYDPRPLLPGEADRRQGDALVERIRAIPGEVWISHHGYLGVLAGKPSHAHYMAVGDVVRGAPGPARSALVASLEQALGEGRFEAILVDRQGPQVPLQGRGYEPVWEQPPSDPSFFPVTGARSRPDLLWAKRRPPAGEAALHPSVVGGGAR
jgi:hypothetical protein